MKLSKNARLILQERYLIRNDKGKVTEKPEDLFLRVAKNIAEADRKYNGNVKEAEKEFYEMMVNLDFLPNSPTLFNAGRKLQQLAACFVIPIEDDMSSIFEALKKMALVHQSGGGTGFSFSRLRPKGDIISSTQGRASGPVSFMKIFDAATEQIKQGGRRRGANIGILRIDHPDIEEFITAKTKGSALINLNISVGITDWFMDAAKKNKSYDLINPRNGRKVGQKNAKKMFGLICRTAWKAADPGMIFIDEINRNNPTPKLGIIECTNPCGEAPLLPYEACNLGSISLANFVKDNGVDFKRLGKTVQKAVHFLDNVIDKSKYPFPEIEQMAKGNRKIGLGVMGFADMLVQLKISYASEEAVKTAEKVMKFINDEAKKASAGLAKERGVFPNFKGSIYDTGKEEDKVRNATRTSVAPTGTISIIAGCSSGIEPLFALSYSRRLGSGRIIYEENKNLKKIFSLFPKEKNKNPKEIFSLSFQERNKFVKGIAKENDGKNKLSAKTLVEIIKKGHAAKVKGVPENLKRIFITAHQVPVKYHLMMQAAFQKHTDNAVSKTVNLPAQAAVKDVEKVFMMAYRLGCKGISVYRYGSKEEQVLTSGKCQTCR